MVASIIVGLITGAVSSWAVSCFFRKFNYNQLITKEKKRLSRDLNRFESHLAVAILEHDYAGDSRTPKGIIINHPTLNEISEKELREKDKEFADQVKRIFVHSNKIKEQYFQEYRDPMKVQRRAHGEEDVADDILDTVKCELEKLQIEVNNLNKLNEKRLAS